MSEGGRLTDVTNGNLKTPINNDEYRWLSYTVVLPNHRELKWGTRRQGEGVIQPWMRLMPKKGASYYPTVKYTIIGYVESPISRNSVYSSNGTGTLNSKNSSASEY